jgi:hypothetical protein
MQFNKAEFQPRVSTECNLVAYEAQPEAVPDEAWSVCKA